MKAIIMAGGNGTRLYPLTKLINKHLIPVYDKPMIFYPITILIAAGIKEFCLITKPNEKKIFQNFLGNGKNWGISIEYRVQQRADGIASGLKIASDFINNSNVVLILGDNIFSGSNDIAKAINEFKSGATIFAYRVSNPSEYGVINFTPNGKATCVEEKPKEPKSRYAVPGIYIYDRRAVEFAKKLKPSSRGEYEITDINKKYLDLNDLWVKRLGRGFAWLDAGTIDDLSAASTYIQTIEKRHGQKIGCPEEASLLVSNINVREFEEIICSYPDGTYKDYLISFLEEYVSDLKNN